MANTRYQHLFQISSEELGLSNRAVNRLKHNGITNIGDCILLYLRGQDGVFSSVTPNFPFEEQEAKLKEKGYWSFVEDNPTVG